MKRIYILLFLLFLPATFAFDCNLFNQDFCDQLEELEQENKDTIYKALTYQEHPDFETVLEHNKELNIKDPLTEVQSSGYIKDAWIGIVSLEPSIKIDNELYSPGFADLIYAYDYNIQTPSGTMQGDCKTEYSISNNHQINTYLNNEATEEISFTQDSIVRKELTVTATINIKHYTWQAIGGRMRCAYSSSQSTSSNLTVEDSLEVKYYNEEPDYQLEYTNQVYTTTHGNYSIINATAYNITFDESTVIQKDWYYDYEIDNQDIITILAHPYETRELENINLDNYNFVIPDSNSCQITLYTHFSIKTDDCQDDTNFETILLSTDKQFYKPGETIYVTVKPSVVSLSYLDDLQETSGGTEFIASQSGLITATVEGKEVSQMVHVSTGNWQVLWSLLLVGGFLYVIGNVANVLWRKIQI
ncbi:hypothetical protein HOC96_00050 [archaeon]|jgi:hypothetical protein|nr:hypothetical protein [archaeon]